MISPETFRAVVSGSRRGPLTTAIRCGLAVAELPYSLIMQLRNRAYDQQTFKITRVDVPVLSVGNVTLGGTGKTPMVTWLARWFRRHGVRVSIISRGYAALDDGANDEARQLEVSLPDVPHLQHADRIAAAHTAIEELETQLILLDDGFQHRRLHRDLDLVLVDATEPFGFGHVFPRGTLREPLKGLRRADVVAITRANLATPESLAAIHHTLSTVAPQALQIEVCQRVTHFESHSGHRLPANSFAQKPTLAFCGIGNPQAFQQTLQDLRIPIQEFRAFPDHHPYDASTVRQLIDWSTSQPAASAVLCTQKDLVKLRVDRLGPLPLYAAMLDLEIATHAEAWEAKLQAICAAIPKDELA